MKNKFVAELLVLGFMGKAMVVTAVVDRKTFAFDKAGPCAAAVGAASAEDT